MWPLCIYIITRRAVFLMIKAHFQRWTFADSLRGFRKGGVVHLTDVRASLNPPQVKAKQQPGANGP